MSIQRSGPRHDHHETDQQRADAAEGQALARYLALRALWFPCWGAAPDGGLRRRGRRAAVRKGPTGADRRPA
jgi:hypothetical protein